MIMKLRSSVHIERLSILPLVEQLGLSRKRDVTGTRADLLEALGRDHDISSH